MELFDEALDIVAEFMRHCAAFPDNEWLTRQRGCHIGRAGEHFWFWQDADQLRNHMSHAPNKAVDRVNLM
jgi:hypothetical protein